MSTFQNIGDMRMKYKEKHEAFTEDQLISDQPLEQFISWFEEAKKVDSIKEPNAMCLATASKSGKPTARYVLLKGYGPDGFTFFTNYGSQKGKDLAENPQASLLFYWEALNRQIRIEGKVQKIPETESEKYFKLRPFPSQLGAAASEQSTVVPSRDFLIKRAKDIEASSAGNVAKPKNWGGYIVVPEKFEFWQGQSDRIHDRICFTKINDKAWERCRLAP